MKSSIRFAVAFVAVAAIIYGCSKSGSPTDTGAVTKLAKRAQAECGESTFLAALSPALSVWEDSVETWQANTALLNATPAFTGQSTSDYLVMLVPVLQQWEDSLNTRLGSAVVDTVADFNPTTSSRQQYLTGLSSLLASWETDLETNRGTDFLPTLPVFVADTTPPEIVCLADTLISCAPDSFVFNYEVTAIDDCDPAPVVTCDPPSGSVFPAGETLVTCTAMDSLGNASTCTFTVNVAASSGPEITCPGDTTITCAPDSLVVNFAVSAVGGCDPEPVVTCDPPSGSVFHAGETLVTCTAMDSDGNESTCSFTVNVEAAEAPEINSAKASPNRLWPPNHKWVKVRLKVDVDSGCGGDVSLSVTRVTSNEPVNGTGDGDTGPDWMIDDNGSVQLRAERSGNGSGRVYTVHYVVEDETGNEVFGHVTVTVPHDNGHH